FEAAFFDIYPEDDAMAGGGLVDFVGSWSSYAYFKSGYIFINTIERGAWVVKLTSKTYPSVPVCNADNCLRSLRASTIEGRLEDVSVVLMYAQSACAGNVIATASSACACL